jgi:hypothetical protein
MLRNIEQSNVPPLQWSIELLSSIFFFVPSSTLAWYTSFVAWFIMGKHLWVATQNQNDLKLKQLLLLCQAFGLLFSKLAKGFNYVLSSNIVPMNTFALISRNLSSILNDQLIDVIDSIRDNIHFLVGLKECPFHCKDIHLKFLAVQS